ncbi:hypothetical protein E3N88_43257 [Mikania micrantha]|uniref:Vacuolar protein sorting-associated protein 52 A n=1 Tax=Mikania micrantha TaxID=192012 RepID=A0A5N6LFD8_9ASTR|nr:hypothetical protein E3N88_43257 [Mikania micrantha]
MSCSRHKNPKKKKKKGKRAKETDAGGPRVAALVGVEIAPATYVLVEWVLFYSCLLHYVLICTLVEPEQFATIVELLELIMLENGMGCPRNPWWSARNPPESQNLTGKPLALFLDCHETFSCAMPRLTTQANLDKTNNKSKRNWCYGKVAVDPVNINYRSSRNETETSVSGKATIGVTGVIRFIGTLYTDERQLEPSVQQRFCSNREAGSEGGKIQGHFEELLKNNTAVYVEELLLEHFGNLIKFVKTRAAEDPNEKQPQAITVAEVEPLVKDFGSRWKAAIELMHGDVITSFSNFLCGMEILRAALTQLLLYYTRLSDCIKRIAGGPAALNKDLVSISSIMYEIRKFSRTF